MLPGQREMCLAARGFILLETIVSNLTIYEANLSHTKYVIFNFCVIKACRKSPFGIVITDSFYRESVNILL